MPAVIDPSPITAIVSPTGCPNSLAIVNPRAADIDVEL